MNFDRQISIYRQATTQNDVGEHVVTDELILTTMAEKAYVRGSENYVTGQRIASTTESFRIRFRNIDNANILVFEEHKYDIISIEEESRKHTLLLMCVKKDNNAY